MGSVTSLCGERVFRMGGLLELDGRLSWVPPDVRGCQPASCYLILGGEGAVLIDSGLRLHARDIIDQLDLVLPKGMPLSIVLTRTEMDCCLNVPAIEDAHAVQTVVYTGGITVPRARAEVRRISVEEGQTLELEAAPGICLQLVAPRLRLLPTLWPYDPVSEVLFTSDSFCHARCGGDGDVTQQLMTKFAWLARADTTPVAHDVIQIFRNRPIRTLAPTHGRTFQGYTTVDRQRDMLLDALRALK